MTTLEDVGDRLANPATLRGIALVLGGVAILALPDLSKFVILLVFGGILLVQGATDIWAELRTPSVSFKAIGSGVLWILAAFVVVVFSDETLNLATKTIGVLFIVRGFLTAYRGLRARREEQGWAYDLVRGLFLAAIGGFFIVIPEALLGTALVLLSVSAVAIGAVVFSYGWSNPEEEELGVEQLGGIVKRWFQQRDVGDEMRADVVDNLYFEPPDATLKQVGFWTLLILSVVIATLGVLADSTAVVIGAMLVAPLMTPIMGVSAGIVNGWMNRVSRSFATVAGGVAVAVSVAWIVAVWTPRLVPLATNSQITSRTSPTMIDLMIAVAAGLAGAYATVDKRVSSSITGVAIAVALVPPLGVVGVMLQAGELADAWGAFLLFLTNLVSIILAASAVFFVTGLAPWAEIRENRRKMRTVLATVGLGALLIIVPLTFTSEGIIASATRQSTTQKVTEEWLRDSPGLRLARSEIAGDEVTVMVSGVGNLPNVDELRAALSTSLGVDVTVLVELFPSIIRTAGDG